MRIFTLAGACACAISTLASSLAPTPAFGQTERDLDSHEHGAAIASLAIEPGVVEVQLQSPWMNLVGFEYTPTEEAEVQVLNEALALLARPDALFEFDPKGCSGQVVDIDSGMEGFEAPVSTGAHEGDDHQHAEQADDHEHDDHGHDDHGHDEHGHDEHGHDDHKTEAAAHDGHGDEHDHDHDGHSELLASYRFECESGAMPVSMNATLLQQWPGIESLQVEFVGPGGQSAAELGRGNTRVSLEPVL